MATTQALVTTTGGTGASAGTALTGGIRGFIMSIKITYASQHANTDVTIAESGGLGRTLLTLTNINTTRTDYPVVALTDNVGAAVSGQYRPYYIDGQPLLITVAQGNDGAPGVTVTVTYVEDRD